MTLAKCKILPGLSSFLKVTLQRAVPLTVMGIEFYGCNFAVDGFNLSKIPCNFACLGSFCKLKLWHLYQSKILQLDYWWISAFWNHVSSEYWIWEHCDNFIFQMFNWFVSFLLPFSSLSTSSILLSSQGLIQKEKVHIDSIVIATP